MTPRKLMCVAVLTLFVAVPTALASSKWYVDGVHGKNKNDCKSPQTACKTIGHAIALAHSGDTVKVAPATYTENLTIGKDLKIIGTGATTTVIDGGANGTVIIIAQPTAHVTLSAVTIQNGVPRNGFGAGIFNNGTLTVKNSTISGNHAVSGRASGGGGIYNSGKASINNSTISGNSASAFGYGGEAQGGGIDNDFGTLTINNSTVTGNNASSYYSYGSGGGIAGSFTVTINNSTVSGNGASSHYGKAYGGGISASATLQNTIVANSPSGGNCYGTVSSNGYNLSSDGTCDFDNTGDLNNTDPKLGTLGNYGGPTQTVPLLPGSPAIDAGNPSGCTDSQGHLLKTDQRGKPRPDKEDHGIGCDMGAYERQED
jgi:hypothetical protein